MFSVIEAGYFALLQDYGRYGHQHRGYTTGGPMDERAFLWANKLLENDFNAAAVEVNMGGLVGQFQQATQMALTGADMQAELNGRALANWQTHRVSAGDILRFKTPSQGLRAYLTVAGGFQVAASRGSVATVPREKMGGLDGQGLALREQDQLSYFSDEDTEVVGARQSVTSLPMKQVPLHFIPPVAEDVVLRVILGPQQHYFNAASVQAFFSTPYVLSAQNDRMGCRLQGAALVYTDAQLSTDSAHSTAIRLANKQAVRCLSEGVSLGAVQVPADGQPIILMADRQTIGGYPKLGTVCQLDLPKLAQMRPGQQLSFAPITLAQAQQQRREYLRFFQVKLKHVLKP